MSRSLENAELRHDAQQQIGRVRFLRHVSIERAGLRSAERRTGGSRGSQTVNARFRCSETIAHARVNSFTTLRPVCHLPELFDRFLEPREFARRSPRRLIRSRTLPASVKKRYLRRADQRTDQDTATITRESFTRPPSMPGGDASKRGATYLCRVD